MASAWQINHFGDADIEILDDEKAVCVIEARWEDGKLVDDEDELTARAKLIAAAPELLQTLSFILPTLRLAATQRPIFDGDGINLLLEAADEVSLAIEKAGGK